MAPSSPALPRAPDYPGWLSALSRLILQTAGWRIEGEVPDLPRFVVIGAPHTSNWDGILMLLVSISFRVRMVWLGKHTLFRPPFGWLMRLAGGVPVNRESSVNAVEQVVQAFRERTRMVLILAPEGTRRKVSQWKSGFYYIARGAGVPIVLGYIDYPAKRAGLGPAFKPTGDYESDLRAILAFYQDKRGRHPERMSDIRIHTD